MNKIHLVVFVHGMMGSRAHSLYVSERLVRKCPNIQTVKLINKSNTPNEGWLMNDGVDVCGLRLAQEIYDHIIYLHTSKSMTVTHFSIFGHSMGGIVARFAIGILDRQGVFTNIKLMNYISFASPHLSIYIPYQEWYSRAINEIVKIGGCPITDQLSFCDSFREGKPLWEILADPGTAI
ncbi:uncharacterized protein RHIMIDRAFT_299316 [Rhizopus microsporus ATCC 52813]|uniref:DUF676 domain-containing protein n=1 Tax=Rhizopus microsporus ATCC 52813 TaxID=1340429 RepID=A0A2G4SNZ8_RHIZD|nr:uncharacterized protein RHIMIDRAFT_299316 [Rhizopus microsporus ATCC 52813]PHZ10465.1 hypothetical protein RHIMIDRAFT_299316 [Rhizopus microsporus ATCC 52813]